MSLRTSTRDTYATHCMSEKQNRVSKNSCRVRLTCTSSCCLSNTCVKSAMLKPLRPSRKFCSHSLPTCLCLGCLAHPLIGILKTRWWTSTKPTSSYHSRSMCALDKGRAIISLARFMSSTQRDKGESGASVLSSLVASRLKSWDSSQPPGRRESKACRMTSFLKSPNDPSRTRV